MLLTSAGCGSTTSSPRTPQPATTAPSPARQSAMGPRQRGIPRCDAADVPLRYQQRDNRGERTTSRLVGGRARRGRDSDQQLAVSDRTVAGRPQGTLPRAGARGSRVAKPHPSLAPRLSSRASATSAGASSSSPTGWSRSARIPRRVFKTERLTYDVMLCRPDGGPSDKNPRFAAVAAGTTTAGGPPLEIVAFLGDNILDFPGLTQASVKQSAATLEPLRREILRAAQPDVRKLAIVDVRAIHLRLSRSATSTSSSTAGGTTSSGSTTPPRSAARASSTTTSSSGATTSATSRRSWKPWPRPAKSRR